MSFSDNFNRADVNPIGGNWTTTTGHAAMQLLSSKCQGGTAGVNNSAYWNTDLGSADHFCEVRLSGATAQSGPCVRNQKSAATFYLYNPTDLGTGAISKYSAGTYSVISARNATWASGDLCRLIVNGSTLQVKQNGTQIGADLTDSSIIGNLAVGVFDGNGAAADALDDFLADVLSVIPSTGAYQQEQSSTDRYQLEDGSGVYLVEPWGGTGVFLPPFIQGDLSGIGTPGRFFKDRLN